MRISDLKSLGVCSEETGVNRINNRGGSDHSAAKVTTVEALDGVLASLHLVKLEVNVSFGIRIDRDVDDVTVFVLCLLSYVILEFLDPVLTLFPTRLLAIL